MEFVVWDWALELVSDLLFVMDDVIVAGVVLFDAFKLIFIVVVFL